MAAIDVQGLSKRYGDVIALHDVSLRVEPSECVALLGPNGAGKSTLMAIMATLRDPDEGRALVAGTDVVRDPASARRALGVVFQTPMVSKHLRAREVLLHHGQLYGLGRETRERRADELLSFVGLTDRADDPVSAFSGGMKRRLDLARVLMTEPDVLLLDEPTAGLDIRGRRTVQDRILTLVERGTTVLVATHDLDEAARLAHRVAVLDQGRLLALDRPEALAQGMGQRVVRVELDPQHRPGARQALAAHGELTEVGRGLELHLVRETGTAGDVLDRLEQEGVPYHRVTVREPDLGDVFLRLTGRPLDEDTTPEVGA